MTANTKDSSYSYSCAKSFSDKSVLVITESENMARDTFRDILFYRPSLSERVLYIPDAETLPFDLQTPPSQIIAERLRGIAQMRNAGPEKKILIISAVNAMRLLSTESDEADFIDVSVGDSAAGIDWAYFFEKAGYEETQRVKNAGEWARRGRVIDIYPVGFSFIENEGCFASVRLLLNEDGVVESITEIDPLTQETKTGKKHSFERTLVYPNRIFLMTEALVDGYLRSSFDFHDNPRSTVAYQEIRKGIPHIELSNWTRNSESNWTSLLHISKDSDLILFGNVKKTVGQQSHLIEQRYLDVKQDVSRVIPPPYFAWLSPDEVEDLLKDKKDVDLKNKGMPHNFSRKRSLSEAVTSLDQYLSDGVKTLFVTKSAIRREHIKLITSMTGRKIREVADFQDFENQESGIFLTKGSILSGFIDVSENIRVITEDEFFGETIDSDFDNEIEEYQKKIILQGFNNIEIDDPIVHARLGVGRFKGFEVISTGDNESQDLVKIGFADSLSTFVGIGNLDMLSRYSGAEPENAPLSKIDDPSWIKGLQKAQESALDTAKSLVDIKNKRLRSTGVVLKPAGKEYDAFCETFKYNETADQLSAIDDIGKDLTSGRPMDRLICGDVGFGKTEVAMRAAFLVASQGFMVIFLAPTGLLAQQHYDSVKKRFADTNIKSSLVSGNTTSKMALEVVRKGEGSIIIGTHKLLNADLPLSRLGLIIIDEEHRFGVAQKESLRTLRGNKHMLAMAATPIPRTLSLTMSGIRDISIISTPPAKRLSIRTLVEPNADNTVREAINRELARQGQVFYLHNRIESMEDCRDRIQRLVPEARIRTLHSKMGVNLMSEVMMDFRNHNFDIVISTTVIEVGIDIPNANTLIVEGAGHLGLAQLHQLRGRVGRSDRQAYAYLLSEKGDSPIAERRLNAMLKTSNLGEGALIARQDMEIRGIGEILGEEQSGHIHKIGFNLYMRLLEDTIEHLDNGNKKIDASVLMHNVNIPIAGKIPADFIPNAGERLSWYQRLFFSKDSVEVNDTIEAMKDFFGYITNEILTLKDDAINHIVMKKWCISSIKETKEGIQINSHYHDDPAGLAQFLQIVFKDDVTYDGKKSFIVNGHTIEETIRKITKYTDGK